MADAFLMGQNSGSNKMKIFVNQEGPDRTVAAGFMNATFNNIPFTVKGFSLSGYANYDKYSFAFFYDEENDINRSSVNNQGWKDGFIEISQTGDSIRINLYGGSNINYLIPRNSIYDAVFWG